jgi:hypothetical protein
MDIDLPGSEVGDLRLELVQLIAQCNHLGQQDGQLITELTLADVDVAERTGLVRRQKLRHVGRALLGTA